jgi:UDP-glucose 4-epimerase
MHYLVTGGVGFVGSHLVEALVAKGHDVTVLDDMSNGNRDNLKEVKDQIRLIVAPVELADALDWKEPFDGVFHLATHPRSFSLADPKKDIETNCKGMVAALEITRKAHLMAQAVNAVTAGIACAIRRK